MEGRGFESLYKVPTKTLQQWSVFFTSCSFEESYGRSWVRVPPRPQKHFSNGVFFFHLLLL